MKGIQLVALLILVIFVASLLNVPQTQAKGWKFWEDWEKGWKFWEKKKKDDPPAPIPKIPDVVSCTDSDSGKIYETKGEVTVSYSDGTQKKIEDSCYIAYDYSGKKVEVLSERYCENKNVAGIAQDCVYGCSSGRCISESEIHHTNNQNQPTGQSSGCSFNWILGDPEPTVCPSNGKQVRKYTNPGPLCTDSMLQKPADIFIDCIYNAPTQTDLIQQNSVSSNPQSSDKQNTNIQSTPINQQVDLSLPVCPINDETFTFSSFSECQSDNFKTRTYTKNPDVNCRVDESLLLLKEQCIYTPPKCEDSDGLNYFIKSVSSGPYSGDTQKAFRTHEDVCVDQNQVQEGYCSPDGSLAIGGYVCPNGCSNGVCIQNQQLPTCTDSDYILSSLGTCQSNNKKTETYTKIGNCLGDQTKIKDVDCVYTKTCDQTNWQSTKWTVSCNNQCEYSRTWTNSDFCSGTIGKPSDETRLHPSSIRKKGYYLKSLEITDQTSAIPMGNAVLIPGGKTGEVLIDYMQLVVKDELGIETIIAEDKFDSGTTPFGGSWTINPWFGTKLRGQDIFYVENGNLVAPVYKYPNEVLHPWGTKFPRDVIPPGSKTIEMRAKVKATGDASWQWGLDFYKSSTADPSPMAEGGISDWYFAEHDWVDVVVGPIELINPKSNTEGSLISKDSQISLDSSVIVSSVRTSTLTQANLELSTSENSVIQHSTVKNSDILQSTISNSQVIDSFVDPSVVERSTVTGSDIIDSKVFDSTITRSSIKNMEIRNALVEDNILKSGSVVFAGKTYTAPLSLKLLDQPYLNQMNVFIQNEKLVIDGFSKLTVSDINSNSNEDCYTKSGSYSEKSGTVFEQRSGKFRLVGTFEGWSNDQAIIGTISGDQVVFDISSFNLPDGNYVFDIKYSEDGSPVCKGQWLWISQESGGLIKAAAGSNKIIVNIQNKKPYPASENPTLVTGNVLKDWVDGADLLVQGNKLTVKYSDKRIWYKNGQETTYNPIGKNIYFTGYFDGWKKMIPASVDSSGNIFVDLSDEKYPIGFVFGGGFVSDDGGTQNQASPDSNSYWLGLSNNDPKNIRLEPDGSIYLVFEKTETGIKQTDKQVDKNKLLLNDHIDDNRIKINGLKMEIEIYKNALYKNDQKFVPDSLVGKEFRAAGPFDAWMRSIKLPLIGTKLVLDLSSKPDGVYAFAIDTPNDEWVGIWNQNQKFVRNEDEGNGKRSYWIVVEKKNGQLVQFTGDKVPRTTFVFDVPYINPPTFVPQEDIAISPKNTNYNGGLIFTVSYVDKINAWDNVGKYTKYPLGTTDRAFYFDGEFDKWQKWVPVRKEGSTLTIDFNGFPDGLYVGDIFTDKSEWLWQSPMLPFVKTNVKNSEGYIGTHLVILKQGNELKPFNGPGTDVPVNWGWVQTKPSTANPDPIRTDVLNFYHVQIDDGKLLVKEWTDNKVSKIANGISQERIFENIPGQFVLKIGYSNVWSQLEIPGKVEGDKIVFDIRAQKLQSGDYPVNLVFNGNDGSKQWFWVEDAESRIVRKFDNYRLSIRSADNGDSILYSDGNMYLDNNKITSIVPVQQSSSGSGSVSISATCTWNSLLTDFEFFKWANEIKYGPWGSGKYKDAEGEIALKMFWQDAASTAMWSTYIDPQSFQKEFMDKRWNAVSGRLFEYVKGCANTNSGSGSSSPITMSAQSPVYDPPTSVLGWSSEEDESIYSDISDLNELTFEEFSPMTRGQAADSCNDFRGTGEEPLCTKSSDIKSLSYLRDRFRFVFTEEKIRSDGTKWFSAITSFEKGQRVRFGSGIWYEFIKKAQNDVPVSGIVGTNSPEENDAERWRYYVPISNEIDAGTHTYVEFQNIYTGRVAKIIYLKDGKSPVSIAGELFILYDLFEPFLGLPKTVEQNGKAGDGIITFADGSRIEYFENGKYGVKPFIEVNALSQNIYYISQPEDAPTLKEKAAKFASSTYSFIKDMLNVAQDSIGTDVSEDEVVSWLEAYDEIDTAITMSGIAPVMGGSKVVRFTTTSTKTALIKLIRLELKQTPKSPTILLLTKRFSIKTPLVSKLVSSGNKVALTKVEDVLEKIRRVKIPLSRVSTKLHQELNIIWPGKVKGSPKTSVSAFMKLEKDRVLTEQKLISGITEIEIKSGIRDWVRKRIVAENLNELESISKEFENRYRNIIIPYSENSIAKNTLQTGGAKGFRAKKYIMEFQGETVEVQITTKNIDKWDAWDHKKIYKTSMETDNDVIRYTKFVSDYFYDLDRGLRNLRIPDCPQKLVVRGDCFPF